MLLNAGLEFRDELGNTKNPVGKPEDNPNLFVGSSQEMVVGNATHDTELTFEYSTKPFTIRRRMGLEKEKELPFQVQIKYTRLDGMRCIRVITETRPVTSDRQVAEQHIHAPVISAHVAQQCARLAKEGAYEETRANARAWSNMMQRNIEKIDTSAYNQFLNEVQELDEELVRALDMEQMDGSVNFAQPEELSELHQGLENKKKYRQQKRSKTDQLSNKLSQLKKTSHSKFAEKPRTGINLPHPIQEEEESDQEVRGDEKLKK